MGATIAVVSGGLGTPSSSGLLAGQLGDAAVRALGELGADATVRTLELRDYATDVTNALLAGYAPPRLQEAIDAVVAADALIAVSPVYTASVSGLFKSFVDTLDPRALDGKPVLLGATGGSARHSLAIEYAMRPIFTYLRTAMVPTSVFAGPDDWGNATLLSARQDRAGRELALAVAAARSDVPGAPGAVPAAQGAVPAAGGEVPAAGGAGASDRGRARRTGPEDMVSAPFEQLLADIQASR